MIRPPVLSAPSLGFTQDSQLLELKARVTQMATSATFTTTGIISQLKLTRHSIQPLSNVTGRTSRKLVVRTSSLKTPISAKQAEKNAMQYRKLGDSDLVISEITLGTVSNFAFF